jgi:4'-phosphopantetheinyl transferase
MYRYYVNCNNWNPTQEQWTYATRCITKTELERIDKFVFQRDAKFALGGQLLIRYLLSKALQRDSSSFDIQRTDRGRPFVNSTPKFDFNLSHHHHLVCIAGTFNGQVGCDTMEYQVNRTQRESIESTTNLLRREFAKDEYDFILKQTTDEKKRFRHFHRLWCLKESYVKWLGIGIGFNLSSMNFRIKTDEFDPANPNQVLSDTLLELNNKPTDDKLRFDEQIIYLSDNEQQILTVCVSKEIDCQPFIELTIEEILKGCTPLDINTPAEDKWWDNFHRKKRS